MSCILVSVFSVHTQLCDAVDGVFLRRSLQTLQFQLQQNYDL